MNYNQKGIAPIAIAIIVVAVLIIGIAIGYFINKFYLIEQPTTPSTTPQGGQTTTPPPLTENVLSESTALLLVKAKWGDCDPNTCEKVSVTVKKQGNVWYVVAVYEGLRDDSVATKRITAPVYYKNNNWVLGEKEKEEYRCQPGRGQQNFATTLCI